MIAGLWDFDDPAGSEARFRAACENEPDATTALELMTQVARAQGLQRKFDEAHATLDAVERGLAVLPRDSDLAPPRVRCLLERGRACNSAGDPGAARPHFQEAWDEACLAHLDALAVDAAHMLAIVSPPDEAMEWNGKAIALAEGSAEPAARAWLGSLHNNIGWALHERGDFEQALGSFRRALQYRLDQGKPREIRVAHWCIARALRSLGRIDEALAIQQDLHAQWQAAAARCEPHASDGYVREEIGECLLALGRADEACGHFEAAHAILSADPSLTAREPERLRRLARLGGDDAKDP